MLQICLDSQNFVLYCLPAPNESYRLEQCAFGARILVQLRISMPRGRLPPPVIRVFFAFVVVFEIEKALEIVYFQCSLSSHHDTIFFKIHDNVLFIFVWSFFFKTNTLEIPLTISQKKKKRKNICHVSPPIILPVSIFFKFMPCLQDIFGGIELLVLILLD